MDIRMDGRLFSGTPLQIVQAMQTSSFAGAVSIDDYITRSVIQAQELMDIYMTVTGNTPEERAESLVNEMLRTGLAHEVVEK